MAGAAQPSLNSAFETLGAALSRLEAAAEIAAHARAQNSASREDAQSEATASWQAQLAELQSENTFLKDDNLRLSNQLQDLQKEYLALQESAGSALARLDGSIKQIDLLLEH